MVVSGIDPAQEGLLAPLGLVQATQHIEEGRWRFPLPTLQRTDWQA